jgi:hypothetical protein
MFTEVQNRFAEMKTIVSTPTRTSTQNVQTRTFHNRAAFLVRLFYSFIRMRAAGLVIVGGFQPKEVTIAIQGHYLPGSKSQFNFFQKEYSK